VTEYPPGTPPPGNPPLHPPHDQSDHAPPPYGQSSHAVPPYPGPPPAEQPDHGQLPYGPSPYTAWPYGQPQYQQPVYEQPPSEQSFYGQPPYQQPFYGQPPYRTHEGGPSYADYPAGWYPYGPPPPAERRLDGWSVAALVCGILPTVVLGLVLSVVGLIRTSNPLRRGRGLAMTGLVLSLVWVAGFTAIGVYHEQHKTPAAAGVEVNPFDLGVGDCFEQPPLTGQTTVHTVSKVPCDQAHNAVITATIEPPNASYPGLSAILNQALQLCHSQVLSYLGRPLGRLRYAAFAPHQALWESGHKSASCVLYDPDRNFKGDIRTDR
jgi:Septum formation